jgi:cytosine deaminase
VTLLLRSATLPDGSTFDIAVAEGLIVWIGPHNTYTGSAVLHLDLTGYVLTPSFVEPHAHLDKAFLADRVFNPAGDLMGAIRGLEAVRNTITHEDIVNRAIRAATLMSENGVTAIRTHADTTVAGGLSSVLALLEAKQACAHFIDIQVAMLLEWPVTGAAGSEHRALANDAIAAGVDVVGGCPHLDSDPTGAVEYLLELAMTHGLPLDLHADENLRLDSSDLEHLADVVLSNNISHRINASHCVSLSIRSEPDIKRISDKVAQAGISVTALPQTNLFLQARGMTSSAPRAITPVAALQDAGVLVAAGADNLQDPFNLMGKADPLEIASLMVTAAHSTPEAAHRMVSQSSSHVVLGHANEIQIGHRANLVAIKATTLRESIAMGPPDRHVVYGGVVIDNHNRNRK